MESESLNVSSKRKHHHEKFRKSRKKMKLHHVDMPKSKKPSKKMMLLFQKRARAYNSDEDEMEEDGANLNHEGSSAGELPDGLDVLQGFGAFENEEEGEGYDIEVGVTKFTEGCRAFRTSFLNIMKKNIVIDPLGPVLSAHKKLVAEKLAEEEVEKKAKGVARREKHVAAEIGHIKPAGFLDAKEKLLISIATKGVVKLFNAVNKAQNQQKGLNPAKSKDAKALAKQTKQTFLSELKKSTSTTVLNSSKKSHLNKANEDEPGWAPLRDSYMLTSSKLKDWDKMEDSASVGGHKIMSDGSSSDED
ncbi:hypothetical protein KSP40_PGU015182 [Platanthera guangdongensis]|uniref:RRP15-like protein n=1 Tax=Platanthera guangdongensis TaxID=2320717 RepID=A0ABR2MKG0_9ASPA